MPSLQVAIEEKKRQLAEKQATLKRTLGRGKGQSLDPLDDSTLPRQAKVCSALYHCRHLVMLAADEMPSSKSLDCLLIICSRCW